MILSFVDKEEEEEEEDFLAPSRNGVAAQFSPRRSARANDISEAEIGQRVV